MLLEPSSEQELFQSQVAKFLDAHASVAALRGLRDDPAGFDPEYWRRGAELGWTALLVDERDGGVSVSDRGLVDLSLVAYEFGRHAAPGPLATTNVVAGALSAAGGDPALLAALLSGASIAAWCFCEAPPHDAPLDLAFEIEADGDELVLRGEKRPVESADRASHLLVTGRSAAGLTQVVVPAATSGVTITPLRGVDLTRRFCAVRFDAVRVPASCLLGELGQAAAAVERQLQQALVIETAAAVGAMQRAFDLTVEWAFDRYSFGRPLASYQALKHRFAHMATWLQASYAISDEAARGVSEASADAAELASAAKAYVGQYGAELLQECVQLHGGIGVTFEHDLHLFLRRVTLARALFGTPDAHHKRLAELVAKRAES
ncbi:MAG TPA: acyl-CoA dehydrogenase family protein [Polyangiales bacterium]|nr:acyl-CoA dehydrogenase family protein [Polyangiales bacterium]